MDEKNGPDAMNNKKPARAICLGGGAICAKTLDHLLAKGYQITVLDKDPQCAVADRCRTCVSPDELWHDDGPVLLVGDAILLAVDIMKRSRVDILVPCVPGHAAGRLAMAWSRGRLSPRGSEAFLQELNALLAGQGIATLDPDNGTVIATLNTSPNLCPTDCDQEGECPLTGTQRKLDLFVVLEDALDRLSIKRSVIRTVRTGIYGAIARKDLEDMRRMLDEAIDGDVVAVATSCSCHAIVNVFKVC